MYSWIAVETPDGGEAYTRAGNLRVSDANGRLQTAAGRNVLGDGRPIAIPPDNTISIGADGWSAVPRYGTPNNVNVVGCGSSSSIRRRTSWSAATTACSDPQPRAGATR